MKLTANVSSAQSPLNADGVIGKLGEASSTSLGAFLNAGTDRPFRDLIYRLTRLSNLMRRNQEYFAEYIGVRGPQLLMMSVLLDSPAATIGHIASQLEVSSQFVTVEIGKLLRKGLVEKRPNKEDRRSVLLKLTATGEKLMNELAPLRRETNDVMFRSVTNEQVTQLSDIVGALLTNGHEALHHLEAPNRKNLRAPSLQDQARVTKVRRKPK